MSAGVNARLQCKKGGLVVGGHDKIRDKLAALVILATSPNRVRNKPIIKIGCDSAAAGVPIFVNIDASHPKLSNKKHFESGNVLFHGLYDHHTSCIINVRFVDKDQPSYIGSTPVKVINKQEVAKEKQYLPRELFGLTTSLCSIRMQYI